MQICCVTNSDMSDVHARPECLLSANWQACSGASWLVPAAWAAPFAFRFCQCIRVWADTGATPQVWTTLHSCRLASPWPWHLTCSYLQLSRADDCGMLLTTVRKQRTQETWRGRHLAPVSARTYTIVGEGCSTLPCSSGMR